MHHFRYVKYHNGIRRNTIYRENNRFGQLRSIAAKGNQTINGQTQ